MRSAWGEFIRMIFVTTGSQKFQFNRLLQRIDLLIEEGMIREEVFARSESAIISQSIMNTAGFWTEKASPGSCGNARWSLPMVEPV